MKKATSKEELFERLRNLEKENAALKAVNVTLREMITLLSRNKEG